MADAQNKLDLSLYAIPADRTFYTVGAVSQMFSQPTHFIFRLANDAGVGPTHAVNGVPHFDGVAIERMAEHLRLTVELGTKSRKAAASN